MISTIGEQRKAGSQEEYTHERKGLFEGMSAHKKTIFLMPPRVYEGTYDHGQGSPPLGINKEESRNGGHDLDSSVSERRVQRLGGRVADALKDG